MSASGRIADRRQRDIVEVEIDLLCGSSSTSVYLLHYEKSLNSISLGARLAVSASAQLTLLIPILPSHLGLRLETYLISAILERVFGVSMTLTTAMTLLTTGLLWETTLTTCEVVRLCNLLMILATIPLIVTH